MKVVLVLCLLAFMSCQKDIMDIAKCLYENPKVKEIIANFVVAIATKDFSKLWPKIKESLPELIQVVIKCVTENEVNLEKVKPFVDDWQHHEIPEDYPVMSYEECMRRCLAHVRDNESYCIEVCSNAEFRRPDEPLTPN